MKTSHSLFCGGFFYSRTFFRFYIVISYYLEFPYRNIQFLVGLNDSVNCKLLSPAASPLPTCNDNDLATYCEAMLQGENRLDRFLKWRDYINDYYHQLIFSNASFIVNNEEFLFNEKHLQLIQQNHLLLYVKDMTHDPQAMIRSVDGKCLLFDHCPANDL